MTVLVSATGTAAYQAIATTHDFTFTVNSGDTFAVAYFGLDSPWGIGTVTWDQGGTNQDCKLIAHQSSGSGWGIFAYGVTNPTPGTKTLRIVVSGGSASAIGCGFQTYTGTGTTSVAAVVTNVLGNFSIGSGSAGTTAQLGVVGDMNVSAYTTVSPSITALSDATIFNLSSTGGNSTAANGFASDGTSHNLTATLTGSNAWAAISFNITQQGPLTNITAALAPVASLTASATTHTYILWAGSAVFAPVSHLGVTENMLNTRWQATVAFAPVTGLVVTERMITRWLAAAAFAPAPLLTVSERMKTGWRSTAVLAPQSHISASFSRREVAQNFYSFNVNAVLSAQGKLTSTWTGVFTTPDDSVSRLGRKATWNVHGVDTDIKVTNFGNYFQLHIPGQAYAEEMYSNDAWPGFSYCTPDDSWKRLVTISPLTQAPYRIAIGPQYQAVEAQPELVAVPGVAGYDVFCGSNLYPHDGGGVFMAPDTSIGSVELRSLQSMPAYPAFLVPSDADYRLFNRYAVYDPDDLPTGGTQGTMFCGVGWLDFPPFTAEIDVFMANTRCAQEFAIDDFMLPSSRYMLPHDNSKIIYVAGAIEAARGLTQLTLLQPKPTPIFSAGKPFICGLNHYVVGQSQLSV